MVADMELVDKDLVNFDYFHSLLQRRRRLRLQMNPMAFLAVERCSNNMPTVLTIIL